ncbi:TlpA disulfide reductase family protein [Sphingobacterium ginsenosidimutans]|uniref:Thioredoxin domain-containing protein n=1 Tax=Sphingobacterium ginsenosidimutans TaxID=687845 RepID=A0ABP8A610_9SPHI
MKAMKIDRNIMLVVLFIGFLNFSFGQDKKLKLTVYAPKTSNLNVKVTSPVEGYYFGGNTNDFTLGEQTHKGEYSMSVGPGQQIIHVENDYQDAKLIVMEGDNITITFQGNDSLLVSGNNAEGQLLYNHLTKDDTRSRFQELDVYSTVAERLQMIDRMQKKDEQEIIGLLKSKKITPDFADLFKIESKMYYKLLWSTDLFFTCRPLVYGEDPATAKISPQFVEAWKKLYADMTVDWAKSPFYPLLMSRYSSLLSIGKPESNDPSKPYALSQIEKLKTVLKGKALEYGWANSITEGLGRNENEKVWLTNFEDFKTYFSGSPLIPILNPMIKKVEDYQAKLLIDTPGVIFLENTEKYSSLKALFKDIKGKFYYVDLWATWCNPCRAELQFSIKLHDEIEKIGYTPLYLSIDNEKANAAWKEMVKGYPLKGLNVRAGESLQKEINQEVPKFTGIPRYLIVNDQGEIVNWDAKRPSDGIELIKQLSSYRKL